MTLQTVAATIADVEPQSRQRIALMVHEAKPGDTFYVDFTPATPAG